LRLRHISTSIAKYFACGNASTMATNRAKRPWHRQKRQQSGPKLLDGDYDRRPCPHACSSRARGGDGWRQSDRGCTGQDSGCGAEGDRGMKATPHERDTDIPRTDLYHATAGSPRRRHRAAIRDGRTWWGLSRQHAPINNSDRCAGRVGRVRSATSWREDCGAGQSGPLKIRPPTGFVASPHTPVDRSLCNRRHVGRASTSTLIFWGLGSGVGTPSDCAARCNSVGNVEFAA
jgi:hypothetical protein